MRLRLWVVSILLYRRLTDRQARLEMQLDQETVWLNLNQMADLFGRDKSVISRHLNNIFREGELKRKAVVAKFATTAADGKTYQVVFFNLRKLNKSPFSCNPSVSY